MKGPRATAPNTHMFMITAVLRSLSLGNPIVNGGAAAVAGELPALAARAAPAAVHGRARHWRNARTHTLHDPNRWKYVHSGNRIVNGAWPPNHGLI